ncbi:MAG: 3-ketoacyl-ACP reductase [Chloroflexi bacterium]|nr:3-ketoacyl-ACP reductase [Chloroflexota bacterium]
MAESTRIALVTGAGRGIGRGIALALGAAGWSVAVNYRGSREAAEEVAAEIAAAGGKATTAQADVSLAADRERLIDETLAWGGGIDLLVNNAGVAPRQRADLLEITEASYDEVNDINLKGPFFLTQRVARQMIAQKDAGRAALPKIVNIGSISAYTSSISRGEYCIAKAGMGMMTQLFADRLAEHGINVYEIRPGIIATDMTEAVTAKYDNLIGEGLTPIRRWGYPEDVARIVAAIAQDALPFSTGEVINVDGGFHMRRL